MSTWNENLKKAINGTATKKEFIDAITHWLKTDIAQETEGTPAAISRRVVWEYPDGYALAIGTNFNPSFYHLTNLTALDTDIPLLEDKQTQWTYSASTNGWQYNINDDAFPTPKQILKLIKLFAKTHGKPTLTLPWGYTWTEDIVELEEEYYDWDTETPEEENPRKTMFELATAVMNETLEKASPWTLTLSEEEDSLSYYSDFSRFGRFLQTVEEEKLAILDLDQHCAACSSGTYEDAIKYDPEMKDKDIFRTWGQHSEGYWKGNGSIFVEAWLNSPEAEQQLKAAAEAEGLDLGLSIENWEPTGVFYYESLS